VAHVVQVPQKSRIACTVNTSGWLRPPQVYKGAGECCCTVPDSTGTCARTARYKSGRNSHSGHCFIHGPNRPESHCNKSNKGFFFFLSRLFIGQADKSPFCRDEAVAGATSSAPGVVPHGGVSSDRVNDDVHKVLWVAGLRKELGVALELVDLRRRRGHEDLGSLGIL